MCMATWRVRTAMANLVMRLNDLFPSLRDACMLGRAGIDNGGSGCFKLGRNPLRRSVMARTQINVEKMES